MTTQAGIMVRIWIVTAAMAMLVSFDLPEGWIKAGNKPDSYLMDMDDTLQREDHVVFTIKSIDGAEEGFGTLMQNMEPDPYLGKRVRMSGYVKTRDVETWAGLWFRVDNKEAGQFLSFDNMHDGKPDRSLKGTTDWTKYEIVLDVSDQAVNLAYGAILVGSGQIWFDDIEFEVVDKTVPTTNIFE
jgi:hypothetical protein